MVQSLSWTSVNPVGGVCWDAGSSLRPSQASRGLPVVETVVLGNVVADALPARLTASTGSPLAAAPETAIAWPEDHRRPLQVNWYVPVSAAVSRFQ